MKRNIHKVMLGAVSFITVTVTAVSAVYAQGAPIVVNYATTLPNGLKTEAKGTINSITDINSDNFKVKLTTKSEADPESLKQFLVDGALQIHDNSSFQVLSGEGQQLGPRSYRFDPTDAKSAHPSILITNIGKTKAGQSLDAVWTITNVNKPNGNTLEKSSLEKSRVEKVVAAQKEDSKQSFDKRENTADNNREVTKVSDVSEKSPQEKMSSSTVKPVKDTVSGEKTGNNVTVGESVHATRNKSSEKTDSSSELEPQLADITKNYLDMHESGGGALSAGMKNVGGIDYTINFYKAGTRIPVDLLMYPVINDIDGLQAFGMPGAALLGYGSNLTSADGNIVMADAPGVDGINAFPLGGALYQTFGNQINAHYNSRKLDQVNSGNNGADILGSYGTIKDIEIAKPDFGPVKIPKASWKVDEHLFKPGATVKADFVQPINQLDKDINHRYKNWETILTVPKEIQNPKIKLLDEDGQEVDVTLKDIGSHRYQISVSPMTMKKLRFSGENYHFEITGQLDEQLVDKTALEFRADTDIDGIKDVINYKTKPIAHTGTVTLNFRMKDSNQEIAKPKEFTVNYGKPWQIKLKALKGYTLDDQNSAKLSGHKVNFENKKITLYYDAKQQQLQVNYLTEDGERLGQDIVKTKYHEIYGTSANDIDDVYSLVTEKLPENAAGIMNEQDEKIDYFYRKTHGYWVELNYGAQAITRVDYHGNIRSNGIEYEDGETVTLVNTEGGVDVQQDRKGNGALSDKPMEIGQSTTLHAANGDAIKITVNSNQKATIYRDSFGYKMRTEINQGNFTNTTGAYFGGKKLSQEYTDVVNGVEGSKISSYVKDYSQDGYTATSEAVTKGDGQLNTLALNTAGTSFKRSAKAISAPKVAQASVPIDDDDEGVELEVSEPKLDYTSELKGSADQIGDQSNQFDDERQGDIVDDQRANQYLTGMQEVKVYRDNKLVKQGQIKNGDQLKIEEIQNIPDRSERKLDGAGKQPSNREKGTNTPAPKQPSVKSESNDKESAQPNIKPTMPTNGTNNPSDKGSNFEKQSGFLPKMGWSRSTWLTVLGSILLGMLVFIAVIVAVYKKHKHHGGKNNA